MSSVLLCDVQVPCAGMSCPVVLYKSAYCAVQLASHASRIPGPGVLACCILGGLPEVCRGCGGLPEVCRGCSGLPEVCRGCGGLPEVCRGCGDQAWLGIYCAQQGGKEAMQALVPQGLIRCSTVAVWGLLHDSKQRGAKQAIQGVFQRLPAILQAGQGTASANRTVSSRSSGCCSSCAESVQHEALSG